MEDKETTIYVVMGTIGEYSDRGEWIVIAYLDEEKAKQHTILAKQEAHRILFLAKRLKKLSIDFERVYDGTKQHIDRSIDYFYCETKLVK